MQLVPQTADFDKRADEIVTELDAYDINVRLLDVNFYYAYSETPVFESYHEQVIKCHKITEAAYNKFVRAIEEINITRKGFKLHVRLADESGYAYWKEEEDPIMIATTAIITDIDAIDVDELREAFQYLNGIIWTLTETYLP